MNLEDFTKKLIEKGYTETSPLYFERCYGKSGGDMEYVSLQRLSYYKEHADPDMVNCTLYFECLEELEEFALED